MAAPPVANPPANPPAYDEFETAAPFFFSATLRGSKAWHAQVMTTFGVSAWLFWHAYTVVDATAEGAGTLLLALIALSCYSAVMISASVRDNAEAQIWEDKGKDALMYQENAVKAMRGTPARFWVNVAMFGFSIAMIVSQFRSSKIAENDRMMIYGSMIFLLSQCFVVAKTVRDIDDADKWLAMCKPAN